MDVKTLKKLLEKCNDNDLVILQAYFEETNKSYQRLSKGVEIRENTSLSIKNEEVEDRTQRRVVIYG